METQAAKTAKKKRTYGRIPHKKPPKEERETYGRKGKPGDVKPKSKSKKPRKIRMSSR